jgi:hypothetical protein
VCFDGARAIPSSAWSSVQTLAPASATPKAFPWAYSDPGGEFDLPSGADTLDDGNAVGGPYSLVSLGVWVDGKPLCYAPSVAELDGSSTPSCPAGSFAYVSRTLYLPYSPRGHLVEATVYRRFLNVSERNFALRGVGVFRYANRYQEASVVTEWGDGADLEDDTFAWNSNSGAAFFVANGVARGNTFVENGDEGLEAYQAEGLLVENNTFDRNNSHQYKTSWSAADFKVASSGFVLVRGNTFRTGTIIGAWLDIQSDHGTIAWNTSYGTLKIEISTDGAIGFNTLLGGAEIQAGDGSTNVKVYNNTLVGTPDSVAAVQAGEDHRAVTEGSVENHVEIRNNLFVNPGATSDPWDSAQSILSHYDGGETDAPYPSAATMDVTADDDFFFQPTGSAVAAFALTDGDPTITALDLSGFQSQAGQEAHGGWADLGADDVFVNAAGGDYHVKPNVVPLGAGVRLPDGLATRFGVPLGTQGVGAVLP